MCVHEYPIDFASALLLRLQMNGCLILLCLTLRPVLRVKPHASALEHDNEHFDMDV